MAFSSGRTSRAIVNNYDFGSSLREVVTRSTIDLLETSNFGQAGAKTYQVGLTDGRATLNGYYEPGTDKSDIVLGPGTARGANNPTGILGATGSGVTAGSAGVAGQGLLAFAPQGLWVPGTRVYMLQGRGASYNVASPVAEMVNFGFEFGVDGTRAVEAGISLFDPTTAINANNVTNGTGCDMQAEGFTGSSTAFGGYGHMHIVTNGRTAAVDVKIQDSTDAVFTTPRDIVTFTSVPTGVTQTQKDLWYQRVVSAQTTINRYIRAVLTLATGTGNLNILVTFCRYPY